MFQPILNVLVGRARNSNPGVCWWRHCFAVAVVLINITIPSAVCTIVFTKQFALDKDTLDILMNSLLLLHRQSDLCLHISVQHYLSSFYRKNTDSLSVVSNMEVLSNSFLYFWMIIYTIEKEYECYLLQFCELLSTFSTFFTVAFYMIIHVSDFTPF